MHSSTTPAKNTVVNTSRTIIPIEGTDGRFEWYQYNDDLRIIHSVEDDMFHAGSIIRALGSTKVVKDWLRNKQTAELLSGFESIGEFSYRHLFNEKPQFNNIKCIRGTYIHRFLVNHFAIWISPRYAYKISLILDDHFELQRKNKEIDRLNANVAEKQSTIDDLRKILKDMDKRSRKQDRKLDRLLDVNDELQCTMDRTNTQLDTIQTHIEAISPLVINLENRVSTDISNENLLIYVTDDGVECVVKVYAVNDTTLKKRGLDTSEAFIHIRGGNSVNMQNELFELISERGLNIEPICRKTKTFLIDSSDISKLKKLIETVLPLRINHKQKILEETVNTITKTTSNHNSKRTGQQKQYMGFDISYCKETCVKWNINKEQLTEIINGDWMTADDYPIVFDATKGLMYAIRRKDKTIYKPLPVDAFTDDA